ncbi:molybdopterin-guanine dinucleotide biosynthesis protein B [Celerinatantimonas sp. MCCC 1A17872]|uniref:molybdopterin-guanine dinucleotide biosynthesis protein B n=1 Tax=Celerinatantimonas sp. MCCC 1A17872 TaxID=3177514 RepID=UPI0038C6669A
MKPDLSRWPKPVIALAGFSGSGKTTLLCQVLEIISHQGIRVGVIKHSHHDVELDKPGKDSYRLTHSGATQMLLSSPQMSVLFSKQTNHDDLDSQLQRLCWDELDLVIVEGYRHSDVPKLEIHRPELEKPLLAASDPWVFAIATNQPLEQTQLPLWPLNQPQIIADNILALCLKNTQKNNK